MRSNSGRRRAVIAVVALLLGIGGVGFIVRYVQSSEDRALAGYELVNVYRVAEAIPAGTPSAELGERVVLEPVPANSRAEDAVVDLGDLTDLVTTVDLQPGEQLLTTRFNAPDEVRTVFGGNVEVPYGALEVTIQSNSERAIGGQIQPGDVVAVLGSFDLYDGPDPGDDDNAEPSSGVVAVDGELDPGLSSVTGIVLRKALVTNVQASSAEIFEQQDESGRSRSAPTVALLITLALEPADASRLVYANEYGAIWFARDSDLAGVESIPLADLDNVFGLPPSTAPFDAPVNPDPAAEESDPGDLALTDDDPDAPAVGDAPDDDGDTGSNDPDNTVADPQNVEDESTQAESGDDQVDG